MNLILQKMQDVKFFASVISGIFFFGMLFGYLLAPAQQPKEVVCAKEINQVSILSSQIKSLRQKHLQEYESFQKDCITKQNELCSEKMLRYRAACLELKCEICEKTK